MKNNSPHIQARIEACGVIAIMRGDYRGWFVEIARTLAGAGVVAMEATLNSPGALEAIGEIRGALGEAVMMGAGTVVNVAQAEAAVQAGAQFIVAPNTNRQVIEYCAAKDICCAPGAYTATEILTAVEAGAPMIKLFPAELSYFKAIRGPLNEVSFVATGGVELGNAAAFIKAGAKALGMGSALIGPYVKEPGGLETLRQRATELVAAIRAARGQAASG